MGALLFVMFVLALFLLFLFFRTAIVVPQQNAFVVERLGRFSGVLEAGFHILIPFVDVIRYRHVLKELAIDIPEQVCITRDNVQVAVDGILYLKILDPERASYGISNYTFAITQLAQTTLRSEICKIELDRTFEERTHINTQVVTEVDKASEALMTCCFCPSALLMAASRSPSDCRTTARFSRSARICFSMAARMSWGGVMFLIS